MRAKASVPAPKAVTSSHDMTDRSDTPSGAGLAPPSSAGRSLVPRSSGRAATWPLVRRLVREHLWQFRWRILGALVMGAASAGCISAFAYILKPLIDDAFIAGDLTQLQLIVVLVMLFGIAGGFLAFGQDMLVNGTGFGMVADMQRRLYRHLLSGDLALFQGDAPGTFVSRFTYDIQRLKEAASKTLVAISKDLLRAAGLVAVMFTQDWALALIALVVIPLAIAPIARLGRRLRKVSINTQDLYGRFNARLDETFRGMRIVKVFNLEDYERTRMSSLVDEIYRISMKASRIRNLAHPIMETLVAVSLAGVIGFGGYRVVEGALTTGAFFSFIAAAMLAYQPVRSLAGLNASLQEALGAAERVFDLIDHPPRIASKPNALDLPPGTGEIAFESVRFGYHTGVPALDGVTFRAEPGQTVAFVGASGAGKSTVLSLIPRLYDVDGGTIRIGGLDIRDVTLESLRRSMAIVNQDVMLFDDTVRANILQGRPGAGEDEMIEAAKNAAAHDFILALPNGYDTEVGVAGQRLSGGQRQRVAIARAMLKDAPILLLDEATSALDSESERQVQAALERLMRGRTSIVIAHRLSTIQHADRIFVMDRGQIVESGTHGDLVRTGGVYARLHALQFQSDSAPGAGLTSDSPVGVGPDQRPVRTESRVAT